MAINDSKSDAFLGKEEKLLKKAVVQTMKAYNEKSTVANLRGWEAAKAALDGYRAKASKKAAEVVSFATKREVIAYLIEAGWDVKVDSSKVNDNLNGLPKKQGVWSKKVVDEYAAMALKKADGISEELTADAKRKLKADADKAEEDAIRAKRRKEVERGELIPFFEVEQEFARRMAYLKADMERFFYHHLEQIILLVEGNMEKKPDAIELGLRLKDEWLDRYSRPLEFMAPRPLTTEDTEGNN